MRTSNRGRKSKGPRELLGTRPSVPLAEAARKRIDELGISMTDYLANLLAQDLDLPQYAPPIPVRKPRMEMPISHVA